MTPENQLPAPVAAAVEQIAECIWQAEWKRAGNGGLRKVPWSEIAEKDQERYRFIAREVAALSHPAVLSGGDSGAVMVEALTPMSGFLVFIKDMRFTGSWDLPTLDRVIEVGETIAAQSRALATAPEGSMLVPKEPTEAMKSAGFDAAMNGDIYAKNGGGTIVVETAIARDVYRAMLAAAPKLAKDYAG